jgi:DNA-binding CsgD family transcriptional regulator
MDQGKPIPASTIEKASGAAEMPAQFRGYLVRSDTPIQHPLLAHASRRGDTRVNASADASSNGHRAPALLGRRRECRTVDQLLESVRAGRSQVLIVRGESGVGKSALLEYLSERASGCRLARATGVESEMTLAYAGLHQICGPLLDLRERLPGPQRDALATAFGLRAGPAPDPFVVGLAVLGLLSEIARERPLVCAVDDAQWLDNESALALAFVSRRLSVNPIGLVFAAPESWELRELYGLPELAVTGLKLRDAVTLLDSVLAGRLDERVRDRIVRESRGNPLTLLELADCVASVDLAGGFALPDVMPSVNRIEQTLLRKVEVLPDDSRRLLLLAATESRGDLSLLWRAAGRLGLGPDAAVPAEAAGLIDVSAHIQFSHPLLRAAVYRGASAADRCEAHRVLAEVTELDADADHRVWHQAHAADAPNEEVAADLERSAGLAAARGGVAAAAAFLGRATELTPDPARRTQRALEAARANAQAAGFEHATSMLATADAGPIDELLHARVEVTRAQIAFAQGSCDEASQLLLAVARTLERRDVGLARETYLDALRAAMCAGHLAKGLSVFELAHAVRAAPAPPQAHKGDMLLNALVARLLDGDVAAVQLSKRAIQAFCDQGCSIQDRLRLLWLTSVTAADLWDDERWDNFSARRVAIAREAGAISELPAALTSRAYVQLFAGKLAEASSLVREAQTVAGAAGANLVPYGAIGLAAWQGREDLFHLVIDAAIDDAVVRGEGVGVTVTHWASALLFNGLCRYDDALAAALELAKHPRALVPSGWVSTELIEAAVRSGATELATDVLERLSETTGVSGTDWALGVEARSRALVSDRDAAEPLYREAIERLDGTLIRVDLARSRLLYGEWLRREGRRVDAREQLHQAHNTFATIGMEAFAERARRELSAAGEKVPKRSVEKQGRLTQQEEQIARLARNGLSNPEIGTQLFISGRTVEWHLRNAFGKLGISSRKQLRMALSEGKLPLAST